MVKGPPRPSGGPADYHRPPDAGVRRHVMPRQFPGGAGVARCGALLGRPPMAPHRL